MRTAPNVIPITELRRDAARIILQMVASDTPVFVTQNGRVAAVLLARDAYEGLLRRASVQEEAESTSPAILAGFEERGSPGSVASRSGVSGGRRPLRGSSGSRRQLVESRFGLVDPETAAFLEEAGYGAESAPVDGDGVSVDGSGGAPDVNRAPDVNGAPDVSDRRL